MSLLPTSLPCMAGVKVENVVTERLSGSSVELRSAGKNAYEQLEIAMKSVGMVYYVLF